MDHCAEKDLVTFCADENMRNIQTRWICQTDDADLAIKKLSRDVGFIGLQEHFDESLVMLQQWLDLPEFAISYHTRNRSYQEHNFPIKDNPELVQMIEQVNLSDIEVYNYARDILFERQKKDYGTGLERDVKALRAANETFKEAREPLWSCAKRALLYKPFLHFPRAG